MFAGRDAVDVVVVDVGNEEGRGVGRTGRGVGAGGEEEGRKEKEEEGGREEGGCAVSRCASRIDGDRKINDSQVTSSDHDREVHRLYLVVIERNVSDIA